MADGGPALWRRRRANWGIGDFTDIEEYSSSASHLGDDGGRSQSAACMFDDPLPPDWQPLFAEQPVLSTSALYIRRRKKLDSTPGV